MIRLNARDLARLGKSAKAATVAAKPRRKVAVVASDDVPVRRGRSLREDYPGSEITIDLDVAPQPKERARTFADDRVLTRAFLSAQGDVRRFVGALKAKGEGGMMRSITPVATRQFEAAVALLVRHFMVKAGLEPYCCPLELEIEFRLEGDPRTWPTGHNDGDLDNLQKSLKDAMNGVAWADDRLVVRTSCTKVCALRPGISLTLRPAAP